MYDTVEVVFVLDGVELQSLSDTVEVEVETAEPSLF
jgi:hypothetical protein